MTKESLFVTGKEIYSAEERQAMKAYTPRDNGMVVQAGGYAANPPAKNPSRKDDSGKAPWGLLMRGCALALAGIVSVLKFGKDKYDPDNKIEGSGWQQVPNAKARYMDALYRHLHSIETRGFLAKDPETGLLEWFHVGCNVMFLATFAAKEVIAQVDRECQ